MINGTARSAKPNSLKAPFPWFGGKSRVASAVWERFGEVSRYVEPFFGSGAVLLGSPRVSTTEIVNDVDGFVSNFWRSVQYSPEDVIYHCRWPVNENDLHARHLYLVRHRAELTSRLEGDPEFHNAKLAGWWCWGVCAWIGGGWCSGKGPWATDTENRLTKIPKSRHDLGISRQIPCLGNSGMGVHKNVRLDEWIFSLQERLRRVRVCCGDWSRVLTPTVTRKAARITAIFLDPPYADTAQRTSGLYANDSLHVAHDVQRWAVANGENAKMRIALCGYEGEHAMPNSWGCMPHVGPKGLGTKSSNRYRERIWFSPGCLNG
jgi:DNA adenine methylase